MTSKTVLVVEDEPAIREMLVFSLERSGYSVTPAADGQAARTAIADRHPDVVLMDWMLPDLSGLELTRQLKRDPSTREIPVIMLTARADEDDRVAGLDGGADDYVTKPFSARELEARIKAVLRRMPGEHDDIVNVGGLKVDGASHRVSVNSTEISLGPTEYRLLDFFVRHPDRVYSRSQLLDRIWGGNVYVEERTVDVHIRRLRKALTESGYDKLIQTVRGAGYRFSPSEPPRA
jgi:two-component system, OmpR family, phosphate regulon response regulator PhoB